LLRTVQVQQRVCLYKSYGGSLSTEASLSFPWRSPNRNEHQFMFSIDNLNNPPTKVANKKTLKKDI
jgi:hypothetical protein